MDISIENFHIAALEKRYQYLKDVGNKNPKYFHALMNELWNYLHCHFIYSNLLDYLISDEQSESNASLILNYTYDLSFDTELAHLKTAKIVIEKCSKSTNSEIEFEIGSWLHGKHEQNYALDNFTEIILKPLINFIIENITSNRIIIALLLKYKKIVEWFDRVELFEIWKNDTQRGEKLLARNLYRFLCSENLDFVIEPSSISGEIDLISIQSSNTTLLADTKIFNSEKGKNKTYIIAGFNQVYQYTLDFNQTCGFLIIFNTCETDLTFNLKQSDYKTPFFQHNNKIIYFIVIDIFPGKVSASKRGKLQSIIIGEDELITEIKK